MTPQGAREPWVRAASECFPSLSLQPPAEDKINGILLGFRLRYRELVYDSLRGFALRGLGHPGATWAELTRECPQPHRAWGQQLGWPGGGRWQVWGSEQCSILCSPASPRWQGQAVNPPAPSCHQLCGPSRSFVLSLALSCCVPVAEVSTNLSQTRVSAPNRGCVTSCCVSRCAAVLRPAENRVTSTLGVAGTRVTRAEHKAGPGPVLCGDPSAQTQLVARRGGAGGWKDFSVL